MSSKHKRTVKKRKSEFTQIRRSPTGIKNQYYKVLSFTVAGTPIELYRLVLSEILVTISVEDGPVWVAVRQVLTFGTAVSVVLGSTVDDEVRGFVDERSSLGIGTGGGGLPEGAAEVDLPKLVGI